MHSGHQAGFQKDAPPPPEWRPKSTVEKGSTSNDIDHPTAVLGSTPAPVEVAKVSTAVPTPSQEGELTIAPVFGPPPQGQPELCRRPDQEEVPFTEIKSRASSKGRAQANTQPVTTTNPFLVLQIEGPPLEDKDKMLVCVNQVISPSSSALLNRSQKKRKLRNSPGLGGLLPIAWKDNHPLYNFNVGYIFLERAWIKRTIKTLPTI